VKGKALFIVTWVRRGTFKAAALVGAFLLIVAAWLWDASLLTTAADENLRLIKAVTRPLPLDWSSKVESALRIFGADRASIDRRRGPGQTHYAWCGPSLPPPAMTGSGDRVQRQISW
jgi:hypothetical protein